MASVEAAVTEAGRDFIRDDHDRRLGSFAASKALRLPF